MKNLIKGLTTISFIFVLTMMFGVVNVNALEQEGNCGKDGAKITWNYNDTTSTLTISGTGAMEDYDGMRNYISPFFDASVKNLIIEDGITTIGKEAFIGSGLTSVTIPNSVITIGASAFQNNQLTSITIPNSVMSIGDYAFENNKLTIVAIPSSVTTIGNDVFASNLLTSVTIPSSVTTIGDRAFASNQIKSITIPNSVTTIGNVAFASNELTSVTIPSSVTTIGFTAFIGNETLTKAVILNDSADMTIGDTDYDVFRYSSSDFKLYGYANSSVSEYATKANEKGVLTEFVELKKIISSMVSDISTQYYKGSTLTPTVKVNDGTKDLELGTDYEVSYKDNDKVGTATVIITGKGDYEYATSSKTFTIAKQQYSVSINPLTGATINPSDTINVDYDGSQNYTIKAQDGYKITSILVDGVEMLSSLKDDVLTISNPTKDMSIEVKTEEVKEVVTDTKVDDVKEDNPKTFDGILLYVGLGLLSVIGLSSTLVYRNKKRFN